MIAKANGFLYNDFLPRARRLDLLPCFATTSTQAEVQVGLTEDVQSGLAAPEPAPVPSDGSGSLSLHQGLATDIFNTLYVRQKRPRMIER